MHQFLLQKPIDTQRLGCATVSAYLIAIVFIASVGINPALAQSTQQYRLSLAHMFPDDSLPAKAARLIAERAIAASNGQLIIDVYGNAKRGDERINISNLRNGNLDLAIVGDLFISNYLIDYRVLNMPFIVRDPGHSLRVYDALLDEQFKNDLLDSLDVGVMGYYFLGTRQLSSSTPISSVSDLAGIKLRLPPNEQTWALVWARLGVRYEYIPFPELFDSIDATVVSAQENPLTLFRHTSLYQKQPYVYLTHHYFQRQFVLVAQDTLESLPTSLQETLSTIIRQVSNEISEQAKAQEQIDIEWLRKNTNVSIADLTIMVSDEQLVDMALQLGGEDGKRLLRRIQSIQ